MYCYLLYTLYTVYYPLSIIYYPLSIIYYLLSTIYYLLSTIHYLPYPSTIPLSTIYHTHTVDEFDFDRTSVLRQLGFPRRSLGPMQMTTDTAVRTSSMILLQGRSFESIPFVDRPEFEVDGVEGEKLVMDFRYVRDEESGEPLICAEVLELLKADFNFDYAGLE